MTHKSKDLLDQDDLPDHIPTACATVHIEVCGFDDTERLTLELIRYFCLSFAAPYTDGNKQAFLRAQSTLGPEKGAILSEIVAELLNAVRSARTSPFFFGDPRCEKCSLRVFPTEMAAMSLIRAARLGDGEQMRLATQDLVEEGNPSDTLLAGHQVGTYLDTVFADGAIRKPRRNLH